jgi:1,4-dihydroxy-2-naphthoyl-CoA synthase
VSGDGAAGEQAGDLVLVNKVVPHEELYPEVERWAEELLDKSPRCG